MGPIRMTGAGVLALMLAAAAAVPAPAAGSVNTLKQLCAAGARDGDWVSCERAVSKFPQDIEMRRDYARAVFVSGRYRKALDLYRKTVEMAPDNADAQLDLAGAYGSLHMYPEAVEPVEAAIRLDPANMMAWRLAAIIYRQVHRDADALQANIRAAELGDSLAVYEVSQMYSLGIGTRRDEKKALAWLTRAAEGGHVAAMDQLSRIYARGEFGQKIDKAKAAYWAEKARKARAE